MSMLQGICAVVPVKDTRQAKQRLAHALSPAQRQALALAMLTDVLAALRAVPELAGLMVVTEDPQATEIAEASGARVSIAGAREGHTGAVRAAASILAQDRLGLLEVPGDIPLAMPDDIRAVLKAHGRAPAFTIVPSRDDRGSNCVVCTPANVVPLTFGDDSFFPHLAVARSLGITPTIVRNPHIALDVDHPDDLALFLQRPSATRAYELAAHWGITAGDLAREVDKVHG